MLGRGVQASRSIENGIRRSYLEIDAATVLFPVAVARGLETASSADFLECVSGGNLSLLFTVRFASLRALLLGLVGHCSVCAGLLNGPLLRICDRRESLVGTRGTCTRVRWQLAGRHGRVVCQNRYTRGTARISHVAIGNFGFSE